MRVKSITIVAALAAAYIAFSYSPVSRRVTASSQTRAQSRQLQQCERVRQWPGKAKRWAVGIGVDDYNEGQISRLTGAINDARSLANALTEYAGFPPDQVML